MQRCPTESPSDCPRAHRAKSHRSLHALALGLATLTLMTLSSACGLLLPPGGGCDDVACDIECEEYVVDEDGCSTCQCVTEPEPTVCWDDTECGQGQRCDSDNYCETPPGCTDGEPCPAVCYGRCVEETTGCFSDADCDEDQHCRVPETDGPPPTTDGSADEAAPAPECPEDDPNCNDRFAPEGICVDDGCAEGDIALPACPPGTRPVYDDTNCGNVRCVETDECRDLDINVCEEVAGCEVVELPGNCECGGDDNADPAPPGAEDPCVCDDGNELVCAPTRNGCYGLNPEECESRSECEGFWIGGEVSPVCVCEDGDEDCACDEVFPDPIEEFYCTDREPREGCRDSRDCGESERCQVDVVCTDDCYEAEDGSTGCISECWETGICVETERSCYDLSEEECTEDPDCQLVDYGTDDAPIAIQILCEPRQTPSCTEDGDCGEGQRCEYEEYCPPCFDGSDPGCFAPCWAEGRCVDGGTEPDRCEDTQDCDAGYVCETLTVCNENCTDGARPAPPPDEDPNEDPVPPPPCEDCYEEGRCVPENRPNDCYSDDECGDGFFCDLYDDCFGEGGTDGLIACMGQCRPNTVEPGYCLDDPDCADNERCATEQDICFIDPTGASNECFHECVPLETEEGLCLEDGDCGERQRCATELDECACPAGNEDCTVCYSRCVEDDEVCDQVVTGGRAPGSEECEEFPTPCDVPDGYEECDLDNTQP